MISRPRRRRAARSTMRPVTAVRLIGMMTNLSRTLLVVLIGISTCVFANESSAHTFRQEQDCLALSIYWEARGESRRGMIAVGWIVLNRMRSEHFPSSPCDVVRQGGERAPCQVSWGCDGRSARPRNHESWTTARLIAARLLVNPPPDPTGGALFYHSTSIDVPWRRKRMLTARIGAHVFYR